MNEELQSANEELETSKEESQTVNEALARAKSDLEKLLRSTQIATLFLDNEFNIQSFTPAVTEIYNLTESDIGRPIWQQTHRALVMPDLPEAAKLREYKQPFEDIIETTDGRFFTRRVLPYQTHERRYEGIVVTFADVSSLQDALHKLQRRERQTAVISEIGQAALSNDGLPLLFDQVVRQIAETLDNEMCKILELLPGGRELRLVSGVGWREGLVGTTTVDTGPDSQAGYTLQSEKPVIVDDLRTEERFRGPALLTDHGVISGMSVVIGPPESPWGVLGTHARRRMNFTVEDTNFIQAAANILWDAILREQSEQALRDGEHRFRLTVNSALDAVVTIDQQGAIIEWNPQAEQTFGWTREEALGQPMAELIVPQQYRDEHRQGLARFGSTGEGPALNQRLEMSALRRDGEEFPVELTILPLKLADAYQFSAFVRDISERKAAEAALRENEERFRVIVEALPAAVYTCDADGKIKLFNRAAAELWGREPELGQDQWCGSWKIFTPEGEPLPLDRCPMARALREGRSIRGEEIVIEHASGQLRHILANPQPLFSATGEVIGAINMLIDITERKRAERELAESRRFLQSTIDSLASHIAVLDEEGVILMVNEAWRTFAADNGFNGRGYGIGQNYLAVCNRAADNHNTEATQAARGIQAVLDGSLSIFDQEYACHSCNEKRWFQMRVTRFVSPGPIRAVVAHDNVTLRRRAEQALRSSESRFRLTFDNAAVGIAHVSLEGRWLRVNDRLCTITGYSRAELLERTFQAITHPDDLETDLDYVRRMLAGEIETYSMEKRYIRKDGEFAWINLTVSLAQKSSGEPDYFIAVIQDISRRKRAEQALRESQARSRLLSLVVENSPDFVGVSDTRATPVFVNESALQLVGATREEAHRTSVAEYFVPDERQFVRDVVLPTVLQEGQWAGELHFRHFQTEAEIPVHYNVFRVDDPESGQPINFATITRDLTAQKQAEQRIRDSEQFLRRTLDGMIAYTGVCDRDGNLIFANQVGLDAGGVTAEEVLGQPFHQTAWWKHDAAVSEQIQQCLQRAAAGDTVRIQTTYWHCADEIRNVDFQAAPMRSDAGEISHLVVSGLDVTDRWRAQLAQQASEERARLLLTSTGEAIYGLDLQGRCTFCNPACVRLLGHDSEQELLGQNMHELIHHTRPDGSAYPIEECQIYNAVRRGENVHVDDEFLWRADGSRFPAEYWSQPIHRDGEIVGAVVTFVDITERRRAEEARTRLAAIIESSEDAIIAKSLDGLITSWNRGAQRLYGYTADEMVGTPITRLVPPERHGEISEILERLRQGELVSHFETERIRKDGTRLDVSLTISPIKSSNGQIVGASAIARDITERKQYERKLLEADRHKDDFIAMLAHELRNPLAPIRNAAQVFELVDLGDETLVEMRDVIKRQVEHMARLLDDLLDVSRIARGKIELRRHSIDLCELVRTTGGDLRGTFDERGVKLTLRIPDETLTARADSTRIAQCVGNILSNALKFTDEGGRVHLELATENGDAVIVIRDDGVGMEPAFIEHLFEPFRQADQSLHRSPGGLGLGLAMVKGLVELHGGRVSAASDGPGRGSTFVIRLPRE